MTSKVDFIDIDSEHGVLSIEYQWLNGNDAEKPLMVFLHEGLGSLAMWKNFPKALCDATGYRGLVYSRPGYGLSTPRKAVQNWDIAYMHRQAYELLPTLFEALDVDPVKNPIWLFGHSDGGSIALLYASRYTTAVAGLVLLSPHIMVEELTLESIEKARLAYINSDLKQQLGRYHADPDSAFWGWNNVWLLPAFRDWSIETELATINCPLLAVQGLDDEYGTLAQVHGIKRRLPATKVVELADCGHSPHRDQCQKMIELVVSFTR